MLVVARLQAHAVVGQADVAFVVGTLFWLQFGCLLIMIDAFFEILHDEGHTSYKFMEHWTSIDVLGCCVEDLVGL